VATQNSAEYHRRCPSLSTSSIDLRSTGAQSKVKSFQKIVNVLVLDKYSGGTGSRMPGRSRPRGLRPGFRLCQTWIFARASGVTPFIQIIKAAWLAGIDRGTRTRMATANSADKRIELLVNRKYSAFILMNACHRQAG
jgi:hypothetical protein